MSKNMRSNCDVHTLVLRIDLHGEHIGYRTKLGLVLIHLYTIKHGFDPGDFDTMFLLCL